MHVMVHMIAVIQMQCRGTLACQLRAVCIDQSASPWSVARTDKLMAAIGHCAAPKLCDYLSTFYMHSHTVEHEHSTICEADLCT